MDTTSGDGSGGGGKEGKKTDAAQGDDMNILIDSRWRVNLLGSRDSCIFCRASKRDNL